MKLGSGNLHIVEIRKNRKNGRQVASDRNNFSKFVIGATEFFFRIFSNFVEGTKPSREVTTSVCSLNKEKSKHPLD